MANPEIVHRYWQTSQAKADAIPLDPETLQRVQEMARRQLGELTGVPL